VCAIPKPDFGIQETFLHDAEVVVVGPGFAAVFPEHGKEVLFLLGLQEG
jgi:hypothetical protein